MYEIVVALKNGGEVRSKPVDQTGIEYLEKEFSLFGKMTLFRIDILKGYALIPISEIQVMRVLKIDGQEVIKYTH